MRPGKHQFSIGRLIYITLFVATLVATLQSSYPYSFIYPVAFIVIVSSYVIWQISRSDAEITTTEDWYDEDGR